MSNRPVILDDAVERVGDDRKCYTYDYQADLNVVESNGNTTPFINIDSTDEDLVTITRVQRESDDISCSLSELKTVTEVKPERDDESHSLAELKTITHVKSERDDYAYSLLELETKTFTESEQDDESTFNN